MAGCCSRSRRQSSRTSTSTTGRCGSFPLILFILSAIPTSLILSLEQSTKSISYQSHHWFHECAKWDPLSEKFLVSTFFGGGLAEVSPNGGEERLVVQEPAVVGNLSLGISIDRIRKRVLVVYSDLIRLRYGAIGAYRLGSWDQLFLTQLTRPGQLPVLIFGWHIKSLINFLLETGTDSDPTAHVDVQAETVNQKARPFLLKMYVYMTSKRGTCSIAFRRHTVLQSLKENKQMFQMIRDA